MDGVRELGVLSCQRFISGWRERGVLWPTFPTSVDGLNLSKFKQLNMGLIRYYSEQSMCNCRKILHHRLEWGDFFFGRLGGRASTISHGRASELGHGWCFIWKAPEFVFFSYGAWELSSPDSFGGGAREDPMAHRLSRVARHRNV